MALSKNDEPSSIESDQSLVMPASVDLDELLEFAIRGDIQELMDKTSALMKLDALLEPFATQLQIFTENFNLRIIRTFLNSLSSNGDR
ncbi:MAG: hypothetical protein V3U88_03060 [Methylococcales bacterium]